MNGFIMLPRKIYNHPIMKKPQLLQAYIYIMFRIRYYDGETYINGQKVMLKKGQFVTTYRKLADELELPLGKVRTIIANLTKYNLIKLTSCNNYTFIEAVDIDFNFTQEITQKSSPNKTQEMNLKNYDKSPVISSKTHNQNNLLSTSENTVSSTKANTEYSHINNNIYNKNKNNRYNNINNKQYPKKNRFDNYDDSNELDYDFLQKRIDEMMFE